MDFNNLVMGILWEQNVSGGTSSAFGPGVSTTATPQSGDNYAKNDSRVIKPLYAGVLSRFGLKNTKSNRKNKNNKKKK